MSVTDIFCSQTGTFSSYFKTPSLTDPYADLDGVSSFRNSSESPPEIVADIPKRDEVVKAFKVRLWPVLCRLQTKLIYIAS